MRESTKRAIKKYDQQHRVNFMIAFYQPTESDLLEQLAKQENKSGYIKALIRGDIEVSRFYEKRKISTKSAHIGD